MHQCGAPRGSPDEQSRPGVSSRRIENLRVLDHRPSRDHSSNTVAYVVACRNGSASPTRSCRLASRLTPVLRPSGDRYRTGGAPTSSRRRARRFHAKEHAAADAPNARARPEAFARRRERDVRVPMNPDAARLPGRLLPRAEPDGAPPTRRETPCSSPAHRVQPVSAGPNRCSNAARGKAPTTRSTSLPSRITTSNGIDCAPNLVASPGFASTSTFTTLRCPE